MQSIAELTTMNYKAKDILMHALEIKKCLPNNRNICIISVELN